MTDRGIGYLKPLKNLQRLIVVNAGYERLKITDAGLRQLSSLKGLRYLNLSTTEVTDAGIEQLLEELPDVEILKPDGTLVSRPGATAP